MPNAGGMISGKFKISDASTRNCMVIIDNVDTIYIYIYIYMLVAIIY